MKICVVGFPRSGTKWTTLAMRAAGFDFGHEKWYANGGIGYMFSQPENRDKMLGADVVAHQVRDPRYAIASAQTNLSDSTNLVNKFDGDWQAAWIHWNLLAETAVLMAKNAGKRTHTIKIGAAIGFVCRMACGWSTASSTLDIDWPSFNTNHRQDYEPLRWSDLKPGVRQLAQRYGYSE